MQAMERDLPNLTNPVLVGVRRDITERIEQMDFIAMVADMVTNMPLLEIDRQIAQQQRKALPDKRLVDALLSARRKVLVAQQTQAKAKEQGLCDAS